MNPQVIAAKQSAIRAAISKNPQAAGEPRTKYCRRIASIASASCGYVFWVVELLRCERIGEEVRAKEAEEAMNRVEVMPLGLNLGPVQNFLGWVDVFSKYKVLSEAYLLLAQSRGDVYATAFLKDIRDTADRAATRAARSSLA